MVNPVSGFCTIPLPRPPYPPPLPPPPPGGAKKGNPGITPPPAFANGAPDDEDELDPDPDPDPLLSEDLQQRQVLPGAKSRERLLWG